MGSIEQQKYGIVRFTIPDTSVSAYDRALYTLPGNKSIHDTRVKLHDFDSPAVQAENGITLGPAGLDKQGFTYVKHKSLLTYSDWLADGKIENVYVPELEDLVKQVTGCKKAVVYCVAFRRRKMAEQGVEEVGLRGSELDKACSCMPRDQILIVGRDAYSTEPSRQVHIDISQQGLYDTLKSCRRDIKDAAAHVLEASENGTEIPRYGAFSVWRPLKTVKRDPVVICDARTHDKSEMVPVDFRALSELNDSAEYSMQALMGLPPKAPEKQKWFYKPDQSPEDVLFIKFVDSASGTVNEDGSTIASGALHTAAILDDQEDAEVRESVEARVYAFW